MAGSSANGNGTKHVDVFVDYVETDLISKSIESVCFIGQCRINQVGD